MGQTQFTPEDFLNFAVDGDGDGRRDIWGSAPDALASSANFLHRKAAWRAGQSWAREVRVPVFASGGVGGIDDVDRLCAVESEGIEAVILGRALYEGRLDFVAAQARADALNGAADGALAGAPSGSGAAGAAL